MNNLITTELAYTQFLDMSDSDNQGESEQDPRDHSAPSPDPQESSRLLLEDAQLYPLRPPPRSYVSPLSSSIAFPLPNLFSPDSSPVSLSFGARIDDPFDSIFQLPDENGILTSREDSHTQFASESTRPRHSSTSSSGESSLLLPHDHSRYPSEKSETLEEFIPCDSYDKEPDDDDWLHEPASNAPFPRQRFALPWRAIANVGFLVFVIFSVLFLFVGLPIYTTIG